jgi:SWI/SNF-related matrix-associated actin-dependent regulator of chromatin subfamily A3
MNGKRRSISKRIFLSPNPWLGVDADSRRHVHEELKVTIYHGRNRERKLSDIPNSDIVLSTYQTIAIETSVGSDDKRRDDKRSPLIDFAWFRIVLDEGEHKFLVVTELILTTQPM